MRVFDICDLFPDGDNRNLPVAQFSSATCDGTNRGTGDAELNWDDLKVALAVGRTGSLTRAALQLGVNQSTATRRLVALEAELGTTLFIRNQAGLSPTDAGLAAITHAGEVERRMDRLRDQMSDKSAGPSGTVYLRGNAWTILRLVQEGMSEFLASHPEVDLKTVSHFTSQPVQRVASVSIWFERNPTAMEFAIKLGAIPYAVYARAGTDPNDLDWVAFLDEEMPRLAPSRATDRLRGKGAGDGGTVRLTGTDAGTLQAAIAAGIGRGLLPMCLGENDPRLSRISDGPPELRRELSMHLHPDTIQTARVQAVVRWLRTCFSGAFAPCDVA